MADKRLLASIALTAGLLGGGAAGFILGVPGVSGAQTTTVPNQQNPSTPNDGQTAPNQAPDGNGRNCPHMNGSNGQAPNGQAPSGSNTNVALRHGWANRV
jgi:hypothetical protein